MKRMQKIIGEILISEINFFSNSIHKNDINKKLPEMNRGL